MFCLSVPIQWIFTGLQTPRYQTHEIAEGPCFTPVMLMADWRGFFLFFLLFGGFFVWLVWFSFLVFFFFFLYSSSLLASNSAEFPVLFESWCLPKQ